MFKMFNLKIYAFNTSPTRGKRWMILDHILSRKLKKIRGAKDKLYQISYSFSIRLSENISCDNIPIDIWGSSWLFIAKRGLCGWQRIYMRNFVMSILSYPLFYDILLSRIHVSQFISRSIPTNTVFLLHRNI